MKLHFSSKPATKIETSIIKFVNQHTNLNITRKPTKAQFVASMVVLGIAEIANLAMAITAIKEAMEPLEIPSIFPAITPAPIPEPKLEGVLERVQRLPKVGTFESNISTGDMLELLEAVNKEYNRNARVWKGKDYISVTINGNKVYVYCNTIYTSVDYAGVFRAQLWNEGANEAPYHMVRSCFNSLRDQAVINDV